MDTQKARQYYETYGPGVVHVEIQNKDGDISIGTAYHIGEGVFITARHVLDVPEVLGIGSSKTHYSKNEDGTSNIVALPGAIKIEDGPFFHPDENVDVACFVAKRKDFPEVPLGSHLDDWIGDDMVLHSTLVMGYPPIPFANGPALVAVIAQISCVIDKYTGGHPHFILSAMPRGGFSGGLVLNEFGFSMGVIVESLGKDNQPSELGHLSVISIEPIYDLLAHHEIMPKCVKEMWDYDDGTNLWDKSDDDGVERKNDKPF